MAERRTPQVRSMGKVTAREGAARSIQRAEADTVKDQGALGLEFIAEKGVLGPGMHFSSPEMTAPEPEEPYDWVYFDSSRVRRAAYDRKTKVIAMQFVDGTAWHYADTNGRVWDRLKRSKSPGRFINRVLNNFPYGAGFH